LETKCHKAYLETKFEAEIEKKKTELEKKRCDVRAQKHNEYLNGIDPKWALAEIEKIKCFCSRRMKGCHRSTRCIRLDGLRKRFESLKENDREPGNQKSESKFGVCVCGARYPLQKNSLDHFLRYSHELYVADIVDEFTDNPYLKTEESDESDENDYDGDDGYACYYEGSDENEEGTCGHYVLSDSGCD
jgi:hypothetical protein